MKDLFEIYDDETKIGEMKVYAVGKNETYYFSYDKQWLKNGFEIDPNLPLKDMEFISKDLWDIFGDISPDRWGKLIQKKQEANLQVANI
ncbi:HipA N-terminal domain-containing protein [Campylobacter hyointestinalis]|uniref:HipA N-terminal domain-containing protein n=1 Tax=Campylobacter hyointestinalis TaxID=198 RepID=UPI0007C9337E|nr:HipA N-terminal domain-containing protein [Campylobacter hyointestinalis]